MPHALCLFHVHDADLCCYDVDVKLTSEGLLKYDLVDAVVNVLPAATVLLKLRTFAALAKAVKMAHLLEPLAAALKKLAMSAEVAHPLLLEVATGG